jgi:hypothetical protein
MLNSCESGRLKVAQWLFCAGCAADLRVTNAGGHTPVFAACYQGHVETAQWLCAAGADADVCTPDNAGRPPLAGVYASSAFVGLKARVALWLVLKGAACGADGHVEVGKLPPDGHGALSSFVAQLVRDLLAQHAIFTGSVLVPCVCETSELTSQEFSRYPAVAPVVTAKKCSLAVLAGHASTLLPLVADFAGVPRGRSLRLLREAKPLLEAAGGRSVGVAPGPGETAEGRRDDGGDDEGDWWSEGA